MASEQGKVIVEAADAPPPSTSKQMAMRERKIEFSPEHDKLLVWCMQQPRYKQKKTLRDGTESVQVAWSLIAKEQFENEKFTTQKLFQRWNRCLNPSLKHGPWTDTEDTELLKWYKKFGPKWSKISEAMGFTRCDVWCRARFNKVTNASLNVRGRPKPKHSAISSSSGADDEDMSDENQSEDNSEGSFNESTSSTVTSDSLADAVVTTTITTTTNSTPATASVPAITNNSSVTVVEVVEAEAAPDIGPSVSSDLDILAAVASTPVKQLLPVQTSTKLQKKPIVTSATQAQLASSKISKPSGMTNIVLDRSGVGALSSQTAAISRRFNMDPFMWQRLMVGVNPVMMPVNGAANPSQVSPIASQSRLPQAQVQQQPAPSINNNNINNVKQDNSVPPPNLRRILPRPQQGPATASSLTCHEEISTINPKLPSVENDSPHSATSSAPKSNLEQQAYAQYRYDMAGVQEQQAAMLLNHIFLNS